MNQSARPAILFALVLISAAPLQAQYGGGGGRRARNARTDAASAEPPRIAPTVAALVLEHGTDMQLSEKQIALITSIRQTQDSANRPWLLKLDSLRNGPRPVNPNDLSQEQRDDMAARREAVAAALDGMREANAEARQGVMAALSPDQQVKAAVLESDAQKKAREQSGGAQQNRDAYGGGRRGGMGGVGGRPPED
jgi:hypothetical protein